MNPDDYPSCVANPASLLVAWGVVIISVMLMASTFYFRPLAMGGESVGLIVPVARAIKWHCVLFAVIFVLGILVFHPRSDSYPWGVTGSPVPLLGWLSITSVFWILPCLGLALAMWTWVEWRGGRMNRRNWFSLLGCSVGLAMDVAIYFVTGVVFRSLA